MIDPTAFVHPDAVVIGDVIVGPRSSIWPGAVLRADHGKITIGSGTSIQDGTVIHCTAAHDTVVGDNCVIGHGVHLEGCRIEAGSLIGSHAVVCTMPWSAPHHLLVRAHLLGITKSCLPMRERWACPQRLQKALLPVRILSPLLRFIFETRVGTQRTCDSLSKTSCAPTASNIFAKSS